MRLEILKITLPPAVLNMENSVYKRKSGKYYVSQTPSI